VKLGIQLPEVERVVGWPEYVAMARAAEESGFDSIWLGDHLLYDDPPRGPHEVWTLLAALAAVTERVALGPLVACTAFHPPGLLAKMAATVQEVSDGRLILGLGAGWNRREFAAFDLPYDRRVARFEEAFAIIRDLLAGETVHRHGQFHGADRAVLLPRPRRRIPLMVGSNGPRMLAATLPHVDAWNTWFADTRNTPDGFAELNARIGEAAEQAGRDPASLLRSVCVYVQLDGAGERAAGVEPVTPEELPAQLRAYEAAGAGEVILVADPITEASVRALAARARRSSPAPPAATTSGPPAGPAPH
jgi:alkanesulfonate monooxygenase SsuD/methylene tetrahydromethanopterin reductase-like flavin-dependent oxidoreductase (luciferase family)